MTSTGTQSARQFLDAVDAACGDLAPADRARLLGGLEEHLAELSAEGVDLVAELGDPAAYAAELRSAAGLPTAGLPAVPAGVPAGVPAHPDATQGLPAGAPAGYAAPVARPAPSSPSVGKVLLVVGAVMLGAGLLVTAALLFGGLLLFGVSSTGGAVTTPVGSPVATEQVAVVVPDVAGMSVDQARQVLEQVGFTLGSETTVTSDVPRGRVVSQVPAAGTADRAGSTIDLVVSAGP